MARLEKFLNAPEVNLPAQSRTEDLRSLLQAARRKALAEARQEARTFLETQLEIGRKMDEADSQGEMTIAVAEERMKTVHAIEAALEQLSRGKYGFCKDCGDEISKARLNALPFAILCVDCKRSEEWEEAARRRVREFSPAA